MRAGASVPDRREPGFERVGLYAMLFKQRRHVFLHSDRSSAGKVSEVEDIVLVV